MKKTILFLVSLLMFLSLASAVDFNSTILDSGSVSSNPSTVIDSNGITHTIYVSDDNLIYINSSDNFKTKFIISDSLSEYSNPVITLDSNNNLHITFNAYYGSSYYGTYYVNSIDWNVIQLNMGNNQEEIDIVVDSNNKVYISGQRVNFNTGDEMNIVIASSLDFVNFDYFEIEKNGIQMNPRIAIDKNNDVSLIYWDWSDGVANGAGQYKTRFRSSIDNFVNEEVISNASQSYGADIAVDSNNNVWVSYKSSEGDIVEGFDSGNVFITDKNSNWDKQKATPSVIYFMQERPTSLVITKNNSKHFTWTEWRNQGSDVYVMYGKENSPIVTQVADIGYNPSLGWSSIAIDSNGNPYIVANIHSLADYEFIEPLPPQPTIQELINQINELNASCSQTNNRITQLENRTTVIELILNAMRGFSEFSNFWNYFTSPDKCNNNALQCSGNNTQKCVNYRWVNNTICSNGCNLGICNPPPKDNCLTKPSEFICAYLKYSVEKDYYSCKTGQGTSTSCNLGQCKYYSKWNYCTKGCNNLTGNCNV